MDSTAVRRSEGRQHSLRNLSIQPTYRTGTDGLVEEFYVPCLSRSRRYDRATGYFDTGGFQRAADGVAALVANGGRIRLVVSPRLRKRTAAALTGRGNWSRERADAVLASDAPEALLAEWLRREPSGCTAWLVRNDLLDVKIAFREAENGAPFSHYHEKVGIFTDPDRNTVAFSGSANETGLAWHGNFESVDVFRSWRHGERPRVVEKVAAFEKLWTNETPGVLVKPIDEAAEDGLGVAHLWRSLKTALIGRA